METEEQLCESCKHKASDHYVANAGACGNPECCGSEHEWCDECGEDCTGCDLISLWNGWR
jgi:hypothetical protein